jgi:osmotically-inducible protein OsmY
MGQERIHRAHFPQAMGGCADAADRAAADHFGMPWNDGVAADVLEQLYWDPKVDGKAIAVFADDGTVTLRGTVGTEREKAEASSIAARTFGVVAVDNQLRVR